MFRMWVKQFKDGHMLRDTVIEVEDSTMNRTKKVFYCLEQACYEFDLEKPQWLDVNIKEFKNLSKTRFTQDSFIETIEFDYLEFQVIEEGD